MSISYFSQASIADGTAVTSTINKLDLVTAIQAHNPDTYFDSTDEIGKVYVYFRHQDLRQMKKIIHEGTGLIGSVSWTSNARDGTWEKYRVLAFDNDDSRSETRRPNRREYTGAASANDADIRFRDNRQLASGFRQISIGHFVPPRGKR